MLVQTQLMVTRMELLEPLTCQLTQTKLTQSITLQKLVQNARGRNTYGFRMTKHPVLLVLKETLVFYA